MRVPALSLLSRGVLALVLAVGLVLVPLQAEPADAYSNDVVTVPMVFPVQGGARWSDTWLVCRERDCSRKHLGQDLFAAKGTPVLATFDGTISGMGVDDGISGSWLSLTRDDGAWTTVYVHLDNDTPGTDDGRGAEAWAFAPGIGPGVQVRAGQHLGWLGDSGNAERIGSHLHFALRAGTRGGQDHNPAQSLRAADVRSEGIASHPRPPVTARPQGHLDGAGLTPDGRVHLVGWAADPDSPAGPGSVRVLVGGREVVVASADGSRPDVAAQGLADASGFDVEVPLPGPGPREVCVRSLDSANGPSTLLGCRTFALPLLKTRAVRAA